MSDGTGKVRSTRWAGYNAGARLTELMEEFCRCIAAGMRFEDAYIAAGYTAVADPRTRRKRAKRLMLDPRVRLRIDQLRVAVEPEVKQAVADAAKRLMIAHEETRHWVHTRLRDIVDRSMSLDDYRPDTALRALEMVGRDVGMWPEKATRGSPAVPSPHDAGVAMADALATRMEIIRRAKEAVWRPSTEPANAPLIDATPIAAAAE